MKWFQRSKSEIDLIGGIVMAQRTYERESVNEPVVILDLQQFQNQQLYTKDISESGLFLFMDEPSKLPVGWVCSLQVLGEGYWRSEKPVSAEVVRITPEGAGLKFVG